MRKFLSLRVATAFLLFVLVAGSVVGAALQVSQSDTKVAADGCADCGDGEVATLDVDCSNAVCRMYIYMHHGDYCSWYSLKCNNPMPPSACSYDGYCNETSASSPCTPPCNGCTTMGDKGGDKKGRDKKEEKSKAFRAGDNEPHTHGNLKKGFKDKKTKGKGDFRGGAASDNEDGHPLKFEISSGTTVYVQVWEVKATADKTFYVGHEINNPNMSNIETADAFAQIDDHVYQITHAFGGEQNTYTVILHKDTTVPMMP